VTVERRSTGRVFQSANVCLRGKDRYDQRRLTGLEGLSSPRRPLSFPLVSFHSISISTSTHSSFLSFYYFLFFLLVEALFSLPSLPYSCTLCLSFPFIYVVFSSSYLKRFFTPYLHIHHCIFNTSSLPSFLIFSPHLHL
jgi:hypothetical protein